MEEFVAYIIKNLVAAPEAVSISTTDSEESLRIEVRVAQEDVGKVIGRRGNTINALRTIVRTVATRVGKKVQVELIQEEGDRPVKKETVTHEAPEITEEAAEEAASVVCESLPSEESQEPALA